MNEMEKSAANAPAQEFTPLRMGRISRSTFWLALLFGLAFSLFGVSQWLGFTRPAWLLVTGWLIFFGLGFVGAAYSHEKVIRPTLSGYTHWQRLTWWGICLVAGLYLVYWLPLTVLPLPNRIVLTASGQKNSQALGSEVWLASIQEGRKNINLDLSQICTGNWSIVDGMRVSSSNQPNQLACEVMTDREIYLTFGTHPWSGIVKIESSDIESVRDLFAENGLENVSLSVALNQNKNLLRGLFYIADGFTIAFLLLFCSTLLIGRKRLVSSQKHRIVPWWVYSLVLLGVWYGYLLAFWPGFLSPDTVVQLEEIVSGQLYNWHPAFHTLTLWLITRLWFNPAAVVLVQILVLGTLIGYGLEFIQRQAVPSWLTWSLAAFYALSPVYGLTLLTIWKDIAYSIAILGLSLLILIIVTSDGKWLKKPFSWMLLGGCGALVILYRHNGMPIAIGSLVLLGIAYKKFWKSVLMAGLVTISIWLLVTGPLFRLANVNTADLARGRNLGTEYTLLGLALWHNRYGTPFQDQEVSMLALMNIQDRNEQFQAVSNASDNLQQLGLALTLRRPLVTLHFLLDRASFIFQVLQPWQDRYEHVGMDIYTNSFGFKPDSKIPVLKTVVSFLAEWSEKAASDWFFWRNAFWMYLLIFSALVASLRERNARLLILLAPVLLNALPLALLSAGQLARYILPTLLVSPLFCAWLLGGAIPQERSS